MSLVALVPLAVIAAGIGAIVVSTRLVVQEVAELQQSLRAVQRLRPAVVALRQEAAQIGQEAKRLRG